MYSHVNFFAGHCLVKGYLFFRDDSFFGHLINLFVHSSEQFVGAMIDVETPISP